VSLQPFHKKIKSLTPEQAKVSYRIKTTHFTHPVGDYIYAIPGMSHL